MLRLRLSDMKQQVRTLRIAPPRYWVKWGGTCIWENRREQIMKERNKDVSLPAKGMSSLSRLPTVACLASLLSHCWRSLILLITQRAWGVHWPRKSKRIENMPEARAHQVGWGDDEEMRVIIVSNEKESEVRRQISQKNWEEKKKGADQMGNEISQWINKQKKRETGVPNNPKKREENVHSRYWAGQFWNRDTKM